MNSTLSTGHTVWIYAAYGLSLAVIHFANLYLFHPIRWRLGTRIAAPAPLWPSP